MINNAELILASGSPRRREILTSIGKTFRVIPSQISEAQLPNEIPEHYVTRLACEKALDIAKQFSQALVIGADTIVLLDNLMLGKPVDEAHACETLKLIAGKWHEVLTGVAVIDVATKQQAVDLCKTKVKVSPLSDEEINWYVKTGEPMDKAGAYAIQGYGSLFIEEIEGNYLNVVGLPVTLLRRLFEQLGEKLF